MTRSREFEPERGEQYRLKQDRILRAAAACFNQKGYSGTSLKDVAELLGLTDAALYYYVRNKEQLVYECYKRAAELGADAMDRATETGGTGLEIVERYIAAHVDALCGDQGPVAIMSEIPSLTPAHKDDILERSRRHSRRFEALLAAGIEDGSIGACDVRMTGNAIMGALNWIPKWYRAGGNVAAADVREQFLALFVRGLSTRPGAERALSA
jgi:AcrR family transcriptional regulator